MTAAASLRNQRSNVALAIVYYIISLRDIEMNKGIGGERVQELSDGEMMSKCCDKKKNSPEAQRDHNKSPKPQQRPLLYDHRALRFIWQEVPILITVII